MTIEIPDNMKDEEIEEIFGDFEPNSEDIDDEDEFEDEGYQSIGDQEVGLHDR